MSKKIWPFEPWPPGIPQASVPANENILRLEAMFRPCLGVSNNPVSPLDGDVWLVGDTPTGAFANFDENDIALARVDENDNASWHAWAPVDGLPLIVAGVRKIFVGESTSAWENDPSVGGGGGGSAEWGDITGTLPAQTDLQAALDARASRGYTVVTEASAFTADPDTHAGLDTYTRAGGDVTFNVSQGYSEGETFPIRATAGLTLVGTGVTLSPPSGGTLAMLAGMSVQVVMTSSTTADVIGQTVAA